LLSGVAVSCCQLNSCIAPRREAPLPYDVGLATCVRTFRENPEADAADFPGGSSVF
jgi:hypothetical protein